MFNITQLKPKLIKIGILILLVIIAIWAIRYYSEDIVMFDHKEYKETSSNEQYKLYQSFYGPDIKLFSSEDLNVVDIEGEKYTIVPNLVTDTRKAYTVTFPNGRKFLVENIMGTNELITYDENLHPFVTSTAILSSGEKISQDGILYYPSNFVVIAYEEYHEKQGEWFIFIIAIVLFLFGYMLLVNRKLQMVFFYLEHRLDVVKPEPSDFYFITTKIGAVFVMAVAVVIFFMSL